MYWQLGNEHYGFWERAHMTGEMYVETIRALAPGIRTAYPRARLLALGQESGDDLYDGSKHTPWRGPLLDKAADLIDGLALQVYCTVPVSADPTEQQRAVLERAEWFAQVMREAAQDVAARGLHLPVGLSEWGLWLHASHFSPRGFYEPFDVQHSLFAATMFHHFLRLAPAVEFTNFYKIISGMGLFQVEREVVRKTHVAEVFSLYRETLPGEVLPIEIDSPSWEGDLKTVEAVAVKSGANVYLFLINRSLEDTVRVSLEGCGDVQAGTALVGQGPLEMAAVRCDMEVAGGEVELPPLTVGRLTRE
jgi:alpha-L-arabinofuranosidase